MSDHAVASRRLLDPYAYVVIGVALNFVAALCLATAGGSDVALGIVAAGTLGSLGLTSLLIGSIALGIRLARSAG